MPHAPVQAESRPSIENDPISVAAHLATVTRAHFTGIGGTGMSGLARILRKRGFTVSGSDAKESKTTAQLENVGIAIATGHSADLIDFDRGILIISAAVPATNPEVVRAREAGVPVVKYAVALAAAVALRRVIAIAGCHGKTTTTAMTSYLLRQSGVDAGFLVGGNVEQLEGNAHEGHAPQFVVEACEYDRSFLHFSPVAAAITNIDADHLDYYGSIEAVVEAFSQFARRIRPEGFLVITQDAWDRISPAVVNDPEWSARNIRVRVVGQNAKNQIRIIPLGIGSHGAGRGRGPSMRLFAGREDLGAFSLGIPGEHNLTNAAMAILLALESGADLEKIRQALPEFKGVDRRLTVKRRSPSLTILDDYGHHPTELRATIAAVRESYITDNANGAGDASRLVLIFQPHQYSRTRLLFNDFVAAISESLTKGDRAILPEIHAARDSDEDKQSVSSEMLARALVGKGVDAVAAATFEDAVELAWNGRRDGDVFLTSGAGDVDRVADLLVRRADKS
ncbi:MAG: UDP-N-acetylmuramate--L-alanine ligase [Planctomycetes bacterium]|nr:UDP-N-acetylmuramate--L-alanine ligase [Planctomycetota bacterium]